MIQNGVTVALVDFGYSAIQHRMHHSLGKIAAAVDLVIAAATASTIPRAHATCDVSRIFGYR